MTIKSQKTILNLFFCAFALIALSACNVSTDSGGKSAFTNLCDPALKFCNLPSQPLRAGCDNITHDCTTGIARPTYDISDLEPDSATGYLPYNTEEPPTGGWARALTAARSDEYNNDGGGANRIGAAYAYARGYNGAGIIISNMGDDIDRDHPEFMGKLIDGYQAGTSNSGSNAGTCQGSLRGCSLSTDSTSIAGIIAARQNPLISGKGRQGIAYGAQIKPIDLFDSSSSTLRAVGDRLKAAIEQASGTEIAVLNYEFEDNNLGTFTDPTDMRNYTFGTSYQISTILPKERAAWIEAVKTTVVVVSHGDNGHNSANGIVPGIRLTVPGVNPRINTPWAVVSANDDDDTNNNINIGSAHGRLPKEVTDLKGKWLTVIALKANNEIWEDGNGCGDAMAWCLGAPGVDIDNTNHTDNRLGVPIRDYIDGESGSKFAAAHVTGAVAVVASSLPAVADTDAARAQRVKDLVAIILQTADDLGDPGVDTVYGHGALNLARATSPIGSMMTAAPDAASLAAGVTIDSSGITLPTSFGNSLDGFTVGFIDDYNRAYIGNPSRITRENAAFTLGDTIATWDSPELQSIALDSNSKMQFTNYDENSDAKDTLIFTHHLPNHTIGFSYNEESKSPDLNLANAGDEMHFQKIRPIASDLMQLNSTYKLGKAWNVKNALTSGEFDTGNRFNEAMANLNYTGENHNLTIGAGTLKEYGQFLGASGTGAYQLSDATRSQVTHLAITQNLPLNSAIKLKYTGFKTEVDMRYNNFANINDLTADEYQLSLTKRKVWGKNDSLNLELIQPFAVTNGNLQQSTVLGYTAEGDYNNVTQNYSLKPTNRRQQIRMTWQNQINLERKTRLFISMQYENHVDNLRDKEDSQILGGISTKF